MAFSHLVTVTGGVMRFETMLEMSDDKGAKKKGSATRNMVGTGSTPLPVPSIDDWIPNG